MMGSIIKLTRWSLQSEVHIYFFDTGCETFFGTKFFRDRFRDFFRYQIFSRPVPRLFSVPNFFETGSDTIKKIEEFPGTGIPGTGMSHSDCHGTFSIVWDINEFHHIVFKKIKKFHFCELWLFWKSFEAIGSCCCTQPNLTLLSARSAQKQVLSSGMSIISQLSIYESSIEL